MRASAPAAAHLHALIGGGGRQKTQQAGPLAETGLLQSGWGGT